MTITEFLLARIAEDETAARAATLGDWWHDPTKVNSVDGGEAVFAGQRGLHAVTIASTGPADDQASMADAAHIARHDPARVLAECGAKRVAVDWYLNDDETVMSATVKALAAVYADHPDYDTTWSPS